MPGKVLTDDDGDDTDVETIQILVTIYLLVGMALVAMCFNLMQEEALQNIKAFWRHMGCLRKKKTPNEHHLNATSKTSEKHLTPDNGKVSSLEIPMTSSFLSEESRKTSEWKRLKRIKYIPSKSKSSIECSQL